MQLARRGRVVLRAACQQILDVMVSKLPSQARRCAVQFQSPAAITLMRREQQEKRKTGGVQVLDTRQIDADIDRCDSGSSECGS